VNETGERSGWLAREREIENLQQELAGMQTQVGVLQTALTQAQQQLNELELQREATGRQLNESHRARAERREQLGHKEARFTQLEARRDQIRRESEELETQWNRDRAAMTEATGLLHGAETAGSDHETQRGQLIDSRQSLQTALEAARTVELTERDARHSLEIERQGLQTQLESTRASLARLAGQQSQLSARRAELAQLLSVDNPPELGFKQKLDEFLAQRVEVERRLAAARQAVTNIEVQLRAQEDARHRKEKQVQELRERLEAERVARQEILVRRDTLAEQVREAGFELAAVLQEMPEAAGDEAWQQKLEQLGARIERLGPINLVAIEEYTEQSERKGYLDKQSEDLLQALTMLSEAIRKMDRETRTLFKETFDKVNEHFQAFFPRLFGGGSAHLELTDNDLLETGVGVMARPPGKRNSTIHLLSGGEKALAAVALIFSIFQLNPAPFCLLDEVDAPLDDANVERYCETLKVIAERTQLIYVTHNKISMEMADVLVGVTMSEPGVSRLVAVDVEEALKMVAQ
jgi:chromosome segregation protein